MADENIEIEPVLETVLLYCLKEAREKIEAGETLSPFTAIASGDSLNMKEYEVDDANEAFGLARKTVAEAEDAQAYAFCYDGYVEAENSLNGKLTKRDCVIAEGGVLGAEYGHAVGHIYRVNDDGEKTDMRPDHWA